MSNDPSSFQISANTAFPQQGQVDWVSFGSVVYSLTASTLQRFSSAGVQPATYAAGIALANRFKIGSLGERRINDAIQNLRGVPGFDQILYFGFGHKSFVKLLAEDPKGSDLVALCSCLGEMHSETVTAWVLRELWSIEGFPDDYKPPHSQFMALAKACAGVLAGTSFSKTVAGMHLQVWDDWYKSIIMVSPAVDIARVLNGLFKISRGEVDTITVLGYNECAFIAGVAQWLFNFTVRVEDEGGRLVYTNTPEHETAQVTLRYVEVDRQRNPMLLANTTYILRSHRELLIQTPDDSLLKFALRAPWDECLSRLFGVADFDNKLIKNSKTFGGFLGSVARIYAAVAKGEIELESESKRSEVESNYRYLSEAAYGRGFAHSIISIFPELKCETDFVDSLDTAVGVAVDIARRDIEFYLRSLQSLCSCMTCSPRMLKFHHRCLVTMAFTLYHLVLIVACVDYPSDLHPTLSGLEEIYQHCTFIWGNPNVSAPPKGYQTWEYCLDQLRILRSNNLQHRRADEFEEPVPGPLASAFLIFVGIWPQHNTSKDKADCCTGLCSMGLCFYMDSLRLLSSSAELAQKVHIIPGHIEWQNRSYDAVVDGIYHDSLRPTVPKAMFEEAVDTPPENALRKEEVSITSLVAERSTEREVAFYYKASIPNGTVYIQPGFSSRHICRSTGRTSCDKTTCMSLPWPCTFVRKGWEMDREFHDKLHYQNGISCCVWEFRDDFARCAALAVLYNAREHGKRKTTYLLRTGECIPCSVRALLARDWSLVDKTKGLNEGVVHIL